MTQYLSIDRDMVKERTESVMSMAMMRTTPTTYPRRTYFVFRPYTNFDPATIPTNANTMMLTPTMKKEVDMSTTIACVDSFTPLLGS